MSERNIIAVVSDLIKTGLTVEQQILVNELVIVAADEQRAGLISIMPSSHREYERERKRAYREMSQMSGTVRDKRKEPKENIIYNNINPLEGVQGEPLSQNVPDKRGALKADFEAWWAIYPRREAKGAALKAYGNARKRASAEALLDGARREAGLGKERQFTKMPATWLNADCWLDEPEKSKHEVISGPWNVLERAKPKPNLTPEQKAELDAKLAQVKARLCQRRP